MNVRNRAARRELHPSTVLFSAAKLSPRVVENLARRRSAAGAAHRRGVLAEQDLARLLAGRRHVLEQLGFFIGARGGGPRLDRVLPALQVWKILDLLAHPFIGGGPGIGSHVGDGIGARDEFAVLETM